MNKDTLDYHSLLDRLLALGDQHRQTGYDMAGEDLHTALFILGWFQRVRRTARAVRLLSDAGFEHETAPLMRTLVEYGVAMKFITYEPYRGVDIYIIKMQKAIRDWVKISGGPSDSTSLTPDMAEILEWDTEPESGSLQRLLAFKHLCEEASEMDFYQYWWKMLAFSHASYEGSMVYVEEGDGHQLLDQAIDGSIVDAVPVSTVVLFMACEAVHAFLPDRPWQDELASIGRELYPPMSS